MPKSISVLKRSLLVGTACMLVGGLVPVSAYADDSQTCTPPADTQPGVHKPVGADSGTYTYDCNTGLWENGYYAYDPASGKTTPTYAIVYTYNATTGLYDYPNWIYNAPHNNFVKTTQSVATPPVGATVIGGPTPVTSSGNDGGSGSTGSNGTIGNTGPGSTNSSNTTDNNNLTLNNQNNLSATNNISQQAGSGNALVIGNTGGGDALTGAADNTAMVANLLQSTSNAIGGNMVTFVANINGDVNSDLLLDPASLSSIQNAGPDSTNTSNTNLNNNLTVNNSTDENITNNLNLNANTGNATVSGNTDGGNATSGAANNIADVVNAIDSSLMAGKSFIGTININGNLNGNIVIPQNFVNELLAANVPTVSITGPGSTNSSNTSVNNNVNVNNSTTEGITNNVNATATTGNATVSHNTSGGKATSGKATNSNITAFNLTGSQVIGANDLLVFVNVAGGQWVGLILNAPAGATAAEFGGGITSSGPNSNNSTNTNVDNNVNVNNNTNEQITNNINANAQSGNATVSDNTSGGNAKSGDAANAINLANVENSSFNLSGWFGILFINVFGTWNGNFGVEPSPGNSLAGTVPGPTIVASSTSSGSVVPTVMKVFGFVSHNGNTNNFAAGGTSGSDSSNPTTFGSVLAAKHSKNSAPTPQSQNVAHRNYLLPIASITLFVVYIVADRAYTLRQRQTKAAADKAGNIQAQAL